MQKRNGKNKKVYEKPITRYRITEDMKQALTDNVESDNEKPMKRKRKPQAEKASGF